MYEEEDEEVVRDALAQLNGEKKEWRLERIAPEVKRRGHDCEGLSEEEKKCVVRCEMEWVRGSLCVCSGGRRVWR